MSTIPDCFDGVGMPKAYGAFSAMCFGSGLQPTERFPERRRLMVLGKKFR